MDIYFTVDLVVCYTDSHPEPTFVGGGEEVVIGAAQGRVRGADS